MSSDDATLSITNAGFATPTSEDHRPWLWVVTLLSLIYSFLCLAARLLAKWDMFWWDDAILGMSWGSTEILHHHHRQPLTLCARLHGCMVESLLCPDIWNLLMLTSFFFSSL
jgi:hypothetical protein